MNFYLPRNEGGFVLVLCLIMLVVLTLMGIVGTRTSTIELLISGNEKVRTQTFYQADGATQAGIELVELNVSCPLGFTGAGAGLNSSDPSTSFPIFGVDVFDSAFALDEGMDDIAHDAGITGVTVDLAEMPSLAARSLRIPGDRANPDAPPTTNLAIFGDTVLSTGSAIQLASGYEGKGKGAAGGGAFIAYQIHAQQRGLANAESIVRLDWQHMIGTENENCAY